MSYDRFKNNSNQNQPEMDNPVQFEDHYECSNMDFESQTAIVTSEPQKHSNSMSSRNSNSLPKSINSAAYDTDKALRDLDKIEFGEVPSAFCNFCLCGNQFLDNCCKVIFSSRWIAVLMILVDGGLHGWASWMHTNCSSAYSRSWIGIIERYTVGLEWYVCLSGIYGILNTNRTLILQYFLFNCYEFIFGLVAYIYGLRKLRVYMDKVILDYEEKYGPENVNSTWIWNEFNEGYRMTKKVHAYYFTDHPTCYPEITEWFFTKRVLQCILFMSLNLFNNYVVGRYYLYLRYKKRIIKSKSRFDHPSLKEEKLCKNCWPKCLPRFDECCGNWCNNCEAKCIDILK